jgi:hypothetical protein
MQKEGNKGKQGVRGIITIILPEKKYNFRCGGGGIWVRTIVDMQTPLYMYSTVHTENTHVWSCMKKWILESIQYTPDIKCM